ncbi:carbohydrate kinase family protein [Psychrobacillus lasiicapitis]|uniref:Carbohydrate kinase n=1 Tax=Psychrobacillus lasiicapitis TaxID=1636719 RepID=A0A544TEH5_9BACI|nr:carbohydrate kinase [Psychrobacillus lasiicapitis]TQR15862.1 carbohydrate kinase [Psychrobacillus lasiicapitis]GGA17471.1 aminoimidazole riboside kinase [Psychrobacillus lasiicapitis]
MNDLRNKFVLIYGDVFVDYIADDQSNKEFTKFLGGATVNVAAGVARLGASSSFITISGDDETSEFVRRELTLEGVDLTFAQIVPEKRVSGVYVHLTENNDRHFHTYVDETPDLQVDFSTLKKEAFQQASIFHFCSGTLFHPIARKTTRQIVDQMEKSKVLLSFDANIRPLRWESEALCRETICSFFKQVDILKLTEEELFFLTETKTREEGIRKLRDYQIPIVLITVGAEGTHIVIDEETIHVNVEKVVPVDTTGAGDAFMAGILSKINMSGKPSTKEEWIDYVSFGNRLGAICATKPGALSAMPRAADL